MVEEHVDGGPRPSGLRDRVVAHSVDLLLVVLLCSLLLTALRAASPDARLLATLLGVGVPTYLVPAAAGASPGKLGVRLVVVDRAGARAQLGTLLARWVLTWAVPTVLLAAFALWLPAIAWWVAGFLPALGPERRTVFDRLTRSRVVQRGDVG